MKKSLLSLLMIVGISLITCGNEPPEEFYSGTPEDSTAIAGLLDDNSELLVGDDMFDPSYIAIALDTIEFPVADSYFRVDSTIIKQHVDSCGFDLTERNDNLDFWFAKDTTCTVYLYDTFSVTSLMHYDIKATGYYFYPAGDTTTILDTVFFDTTFGTYELPFTGNGYRIIFFDYDETDGWALKRISYGTYNFPASGTDIPAIDTIILTRGSGDADTIIYSSHDTLYTGHAMNRFLAIDSLLEFASGDTTITVEIILPFGGADPFLCSFFASCGGTDRVELPGGSGTLKLSGQGITNLYFETMLNDSYYYVQPQKEYKAQVWLVPVRIGGS